MPFSMPDATRVHPITLPDGSIHKGTVLLSNVIDQPNIDVGDYTYASDFDPPPPDGWAARLAPYHFPMSEGQLTIGRFCQIAHGVRFITAAANHAHYGLTSFPFGIFALDQEVMTQPDSRETKIGNDVWLGYGAIVCPAVTIGNGAIIGAGAVVSEDVPDYTIVAGNPARVVKLRLPPEDIAKMNRLAWWDWPVDRIAQARHALEAGDLDGLEALAPDA
ncbi:CatB-related O-acetyltransferase [Aliiroseovarius sp. F47248L]|uniref:CatB-related O-acetyltransferase n=1 Tax=Aliiroseovarius sp. F47248L TaxID=2926420 RepID=UPI001FF4F67F|nr:CatB-related O-acetyltransferase [Aliiroseovarius sp. F47248L]MCK0138163.1 CatB-related O-acetyltransferase [Aliiroseovarius sp. F47248L]